MNRSATLLWVLIAAVSATGAVGAAVAGGAAGGDSRSSLRPLADGKWDRAAAAHLLRRAGFGGTRVELDRLAAQPLAAAVDGLVEYRSLVYEPAPPVIDDELYRAPDRRALRELGEQERRQLRQQRNRLERQAFEEVRLWWLERMVESPRPLEEKMTLFWHGHFTSGYREVRDATLMFEQNELLRRHALGNFGDLVQAISRDRAMLAYLDGRRNRKDHPNENYARELLELFTLGEGHYSEQDIQAAARAFTGWTYDRHGFRFDPRQHDYGEKRFLGRTGRFNGDEIIEIILEQPQCSRRLAKALLTFFVRPDPDRRLVEALAAEIRRQRYELRPVLRTLLMSEAFYHPEARGSLIKSPVELVVGAARTLGVRLYDLRAAERALARMGQELMQPPNVKGWDGHAAWINTATLLARYNAVSGLIHGVARRSGGGMLSAGDAEIASGPSRDELNDEEMLPARPAPRSRMVAGDQPPVDVLALVAAQGLSESEEIVAYLCDALLAAPLSPEKRRALVGYLDGDGRFRLEQRDAAQRLRMLATLICSTPEYQLN